MRCGPPVADWSDRRLQVTVIDTGPGFDSGAVPLRGITSSIVERGQDAGIDATIHSRPGSGTTVILTVGAPRTEPVLDEATGDTVEQVTGRAAALWGIGVTVVGAVLALTGGTNEHHALWPMLALMLLACCVPLALRHRPTAAVVLTVLTMTIFVLSSAATGFGTIGIPHWQALAPTGAAVTLLAMRPSGRSVALGATAWAGTVAVLALTAQTPTAAAANLIAGAVGIGFATAWGGFQHVVERVTGDAFAARQRSFAAQLLIDAEQAARRTYLRWLAAGLDSAIALLSAIADGDRDPRVAAVVEACGHEETHLRQLIQIGPELPPRG